MRCTPDPVVVNGIEMAVAELAGRARSLQEAFDQFGTHILETLRRLTGS